MNEIIDLRTGTQIAAQYIQADLFSDWIRSIDAKPKTVETYTRSIRQFYNWLLSRDISNPTEDDIVAFKADMGLTRKPSTVQGYLMAVKQFFHWTEKRGFYPDIAKDVKSVEIDDGFKKDYLTPSQVKDVLGTFDQSTDKGLRDYAVFCLMVTTGLRTIEVQRANIEDIRPAGNDMALYIQGKGRSSKNEYVKLAKPVEKAIRSYLATRPMASGSDPLFTSTAHRNGGDRMTTRSISRIAKNSMVDASLISDRLTAHSLRHTAAITNLMNGGTLEETQIMLRHTSSETTKKYSHMVERANNNSEIRVAGVFFN